MLEYGDHLLEQSRSFSLSRVQSLKLPNGGCRGCECTDLQTYLVVMAVSTVRRRNLTIVRTCHRRWMLLIFAFDATSFSRRSPDFHSSLKPGNFLLPRFGLIEFSQSSSSRMILRVVRPGGEREGVPRILCELL